MNRQFSNPSPSSVVAQSPAAVVVRGVRKVFSRTEARATSVKESLLGSLAQRNDQELVVALDGIDLAIAPGEALGLIGSNGSGKSTLLKLIAGIMTPTNGTVAAHGTVLGLIELGAGFHPDLTGEENIRLQAAIYGLEASAVEAAIEPILEFAGLTDFRHMPVRHYSSGMFVRLGFAIAVHAVPDILLVDEVLSVGDQTFQERCLSEIGRLRARGMTLVFVTHFPDQAERLCDRIAWLEKGRLRQVGPASEVLAAYHDDLIGRQFSTSEGGMTDRRLAVGLPGRFGSGEARIEAVRLLDAAGALRTSFRRGEPIAVEIDYAADPSVEAVDCTLPIDAQDGTTLTLWRAEREGGLSHPTGGLGRLRMEIPAPPLLPGRYTLTISISPPGRPSDHYDCLYRLFAFTIEPDSTWPTVAPLELRPVVE